eukprot:scaffold37801_cov85-Cyclotella_meneghiniana.AAC.3
MGNPVRVRCDESTKDQKAEEKEQKMISKVEDRPIATKARTEPLQRNNLTTFNFYHTAGSQLLTLSYLTPHYEHSGHRSISRISAHSAQHGGNGRNCSSNPITQGCRGRDRYGSSWCRDPVNTK